MNKPPSARVLATIYACSERSIRNYRADGAPLDDPTAMWAWWSSRKNMPRAVAAKGLAAIQEAFAAVVGDAAGTRAAALPQEPTVPAAATEAPDLPAGAAHELRWLEGLAVEARRNLIRARASGDPVAMKRDLDAYLKITESLRKFDHQVAAERRDAGEMVSRTQIEAPITALTCWLRRGVEGAINSASVLLAEADSPQRVYELIAEPFRRSLGNAVDAGCADGKFPPWMKQAFEAGL